MSKKFKLAFKDGCDFLHEALGLTNDRAEDLRYRMECIVHDFLRPTKENVLPDSDVLVKLFMALAENTQEVAYLSYCAGETVERIFGAVAEYNRGDIEG